MRLTTGVILLTVFQLSAAATFGQKFTYKSKSTTISELFRKIKEQTGFNVFWSDTRLSSNEQIEVNYHKTSIENVMDDILHGRSVTYKIIGKQIIVSKHDANTFREKYKKLLSILNSIEVRGRVLGENDEPLEGAIVKIKGGSGSTRTDSNGEFLLKNVEENATLTISFLGYEMQEIQATKEFTSVKLVISIGKLEEVEVVSTGYQNISTERLTGSYTIIDNKTINRAVSPDLLSRLKGVSNGLLFDSNTGNSLGISIRGRSTIFSDTKPLIVIDNFPFEGDINSINPNDVENIFLLKDASASSIWGVRAGNGVIVITTKKGKLNQKPNFDFNSNLTIGQKPDLYYTPQLNSSDFIDLEKFQFSNGKYTSDLLNDYALISPVIELLAKRTSTNAKAIDKSIETLKQYDVREQIDKYFYRNSLQQQYYLNLNGGESNFTYNISAGYDRNKAVDVGSFNDRITLKFKNVYELLNHNLKFTTDVSVDKSKSTDDNAIKFRQIYPYQQIADQNGNALGVLSNMTLRASYTDTAGNNKLLDWKYRPLEELRQKSNASTIESTNIRLNSIVKYQILDPLSITINYQYFRSIGTNDLLRDLNSFQTRNDINRVTQINSTTGAISYPMPLGMQFSKNEVSAISNYGRIQLDFNKAINDKHIFNAFAGYEIRSEVRSNNALYLYGYDPETKTNVTPDNVNIYKFYYNEGATIFNMNPSTQFGTVDHYISYYANASYSFYSRYVLSGSYRKDESNLFGVSANQKGVPLWSTGIAWNVNKESFFDFHGISRLQLKASFGYNGNVNQTLSAYTTASPNTSLNLWGESSLNITNPPNPSLGWERIRNINIGFEFALKKDILTGTLEYYSKKGIDLIGTSPIAQQTGVLLFTGNIANTKTKGFDVQINSRNIDREFRWYSTAFLNFTKDKITNYMVNVGLNINTVNPISINPIEDFPIRSIFSFRSTHLDSLGNPQGFINGAISKDYNSIQNSTNRDELIFHGSGVPTIFGAIRNTFTYKAFELSFNMTFKLDYYFRKTALQYNRLLSGTDSSGEYGQRWQKLGDEKITNVPSMIYPAVFARDMFYAYSQITIEKGDHIRFNDVQFSYSIPSIVVKRMHLKSFLFYAYANNLGILWRANSFNQDPEALNSMPMPMSISFGFKTNF